MAKGQSTIDINVSTTEDANAAFWREASQRGKIDIELAAKWTGQQPPTSTFGASGVPPAYSAPPPVGTTGRRTAPNPTSVTTPGSPANNMWRYNLEREQLKYYKTVPKTFEALYSNVARMSTSLTGLSTGLMRLGGVGTLAAAPVAASAFALDRAGQWRERQARAQAFGLTPYQEQAFANNLKMYTGGAAGTQALFSGLLQQQTTIGGSQFLQGFLRQWGVKTTGKETPEESAENVLRAERRIATTTNPSMWQTYATMYPGMGDITDIATMMRFKTGNVTEQQLNADIARARATAKGGPTGKNLVEISQQFDNVMIKVNQGLDKFADKLAGTGLKIEKWVSDNFEIVPKGGTPRKMKDRKWEMHIDLDAAEKALTDTFKGITDWWNGTGANLPSKNATPESFDKTTFGNQFLIPGTKDKIAELNKDVVKTSDSLDEFSRKLLATSNILAGGSGAYLAARAGGVTGAAGGFVTTLGPGGAPISAAGIYGGGGGFAGAGDGRSGAPGGIVGRGTGGAAARPAKGALKANQRERL